MRRLAAALLLVLAAAGPAAAQEGPVRVRSEVDRAAMTIGEQVLFTIVVDLAAGYDLRDPGVPRVIGDFEVVDTLTVLQTRSPSGGARVQLRYLVTTFELGPRQLPIVVVGYRGPDGQPGEAETAAGHAIQVVSVVLPEEDTSDIKPLKPPLPIGAGASALEQWAPAAALALAVLAAAVLALRIRRRPRVAFDEPMHGPARRAFDELEALAQRRLVEQGRTREHYDVLATTLRRYSADRFGMRAEALTARELRRDLERGGVDRAQAQIIFEALQDAEAVRYEERVLYPARAQKTMRDVLDMMRRSIAVEEYELIESGATA